MQWNGSEQKINKRRVRWSVRRLAPIDAASLSFPLPHFALSLCPASSSAPCDWSMLRLTIFDRKSAFALVAASATSLAMLSCLFFCSSSAVRPWTCCSSEALYSLSAPYRRALSMDSAAWLQRSCSS